MEARPYREPVPQIEANGTPDKTSFWNMNIPISLHTKDCPSYLEYARTSDKDRGILSTPDADYHYQSWPEVQEIIRDNRLDAFERLPSDLRRYRQYCAKLVEEYGSVMEFVMKERLQWKDLKPASDVPFKNDDDIKILYNDWPYGIDSRIVHLVVWTKFPLPASDTDPQGDLTPELRKLCDDFVDKTFVSVCGKENVIWFKNWASLKSIHAVEHIHVMLFDPDLDFVRRITGGDAPLAEKVGKP